MTSDGEPELQAFRGRTREERKRVLADLHDERRRARSDEERQRLGARLRRYEQAHSEMED